MGQDARDRLFPAPDPHHTRDRTRRSALARTFHHRQLAQGRPDAERHQRADLFRPDELSPGVARRTGLYPSDDPSAHTRDPEPDRASPTTPGRRPNPLRPGERQAAARLRQSHRAGAPKAGWEDFGTAGVLPASWCLIAQISDKVYTPCG